MLREKRRPKVASPGLKSSQRVGLTPDPVALSASPRTMISITRSGAFWASASKVTCHEGLSIPTLRRGDPLINCCISCPRRHHGAAQRPLDFLRRRGLAGPPAVTLGGHRPWELVPGVAGTPLAHESLMKPPRPSGSGPVLLPALPRFGLLRPVRASEARPVFLGRPHIRESFVGFAPGPSTCSLQGVSVQRGPSGLCRRVSGLNGTAHQRVSRGTRP